MRNRGTVWPDEVVLQSDLSPATWIAQRLAPWGNGVPVTLVVPTGYPAYARVLHPVGAPGNVSYSWRVVCISTDRSYHPLMRYDYISPRADEPQRPRRVYRPHSGTLTTKLCTDLYGFLSRWSPGAECWLGIWEGSGSLTGTTSRFRPDDSDDDSDEEYLWLEQGLADVTDRVAAAPRFEHPHRRYLLARSPLVAIPRLSYFPLGVNPNLAWPDDRSWFVGTEIDFDSTLVAGSAEMVASLVADDRFEAFEVQPDDRLDIGGDVVNGPAQG